MGQFKSEQVSDHNLLILLDSAHLTRARYWEAKLAVGHVPSEA